MSTPPPGGGSGGRTLLVPVEDNEACIAALKWTLTHIYRPGDSLLFLRVIPDPPAAATCKSSFDCSPAGPPGLETGRHLEAAQSAITSRFTPLADAAGAPYVVQIATSADTSCEAVGRLICDRAASGAALVSMAAHNKGTLARVCLGSVTQHCVDHCPCTVMVMREGIAAKAAAPLVPPPS